MVKNVNYSPLLAAAVTDNHSPHLLVTSSLVLFLSKGFSNKEEYFRSRTRMQIRSFVTKPGKKCKHNKKFNGKVETDSTNLT